MPTMAPGTEAFSIAAGMTASSAASRLSAAIDALHAVRSEVASVVMIATPRSGRNVSGLFIVFPARRRNQRSVLRPPGYGWQIGRLCAAQNLVDQADDMPVTEQISWSIGEQSAIFRALRPLINRRQACR